MAEALKDVKEFQRDCTSCSICLNTFTKPISLPCLHTFCFQCIDDFRERNDMEGSIAHCPMCRADMPQTADGLRKLPINFFINRLIELNLNSAPEAPVAVVHYCDPCRGGVDAEKKMARIQCVECREKLCEDCVAAHRKLKITRDHELIEIGKNGEKELVKAVSRKAMMCKLHSDYKLDMFCETCSTTVCVKCCMQNHKDHKYIDISEAGKNCKTELIRIIDLVSNEVTCLNDTLEQIEQKRETMKETHETMQELVEERAQAIIDEIESRKEKILEEMEDNYKTAEVTMDDTSRAKREKAASLSALLKSCVGLKESGTNFELADMTGKYKIKAAELESKSQNVEKPNSDASVDFEYSFKPGTTDKNQSSRVKSLFGNVNFKQILPGGDGSSSLGNAEQSADGNTEEILSTSSAKPKRKNKKAKQPPQENPKEDDLESIETCSVFSTVSTPQHSDDEETGDNRRLISRINISASYGCGIGKAGSKPIQGIVLWNGKVYIARNATPSIDIHDIGSKSKNPERQLQVAGLTNATDMVVDRRTGCMFVGDWSSSTVLKLDFNRKDEGVDIVKLRVAGRPNGLSITPESTLVVTSTNEMKFMEYNFSGERIREVLTGLHKPRHVVKISHNEFIMASGDEENGFTISRISLDQSGNMRTHQQYGGPRAPARFKLSDARHIVVDGRTDLLYVANNKENQVIALRIQSLFRIGSSLIDETKIASPSRLAVDPVTGHLYVGCLTGQLAQFSLEISEEKVEKRGGSNYRRPYDRSHGRPGGPGQRRPQGQGSGNRGPSQGQGPFNRGPSQGQGPFNRGLSQGQGPFYRGPSQGQGPGNRGPSYRGPRYPNTAARSMENLADPRPNLVDFNLHYL